MGFIAVLSILVPLRHWKTTQHGNKKQLSWQTRTSMITMTLRSSPRYRIGCRLSHNDRFRQGPMLKGRRRLTRIRDQNPKRGPVQFSQLVLYPCSRPLSWAWSLYLLIRIQTVSSRTIVAGHPCYNYVSATSSQACHILQGLCFFFHLKTTIRMDASLLLEDIEPSPHVPWYSQIYAYANDGQIGFWSIFRLRIGTLMGFTTGFLTESISSVQSLMCDSKKI